MTRKEFYRLYIPALKKALSRDHVNHGFYVKPPEDYIEDASIYDIENYIESNEDEFLEQIAYYFDAKSHDFPEIQGILIDEFKRQIILAIENEEYKLTKRRSNNKRSDENNDLLDDQYIG